MTQRGIRVTEPSDEFESLGLQRVRDLGEETPAVY